MVGSSRARWSCLLCGHLALNSTNDRGVIDGHTAFMQEFCAIAIAQGIAEISARGEEKGVSFHVAPREG